MEDLLTLCTMFDQQTNQLMNIVSQFQAIEYQMLQLVNAENLVTDIKSQIQAYCGAANVQKIAMDSQEAIVQGILDRISALVN